MVKNLYKKTWHTSSLPMVRTKVHGQFGALAALSYRLSQKKASSGESGTNSYMKEET